MVMGAVLAGAAALVRLAAGAASVLGALGWANEKVAAWADRAIERLEEGVRSRLQRLGEETAQHLRETADQRLLATLALCIASVPVALMFDAPAAPWVAAGILAVPLLWETAHAVGRARGFLRWLAGAREEARQASDRLDDGDAVAAVDFLHEAAGFPLPTGGLKAARLAARVPGWKGLRDLLRRALDSVLAWLEEPARWRAPFLEGFAGPVGKGLLREAVVLLLAGGLARGAVVLFLLAR